MSKRRWLFMLVAATAAAPFIGLDWVFGDHDTWSGWTPFLKHRPTFTFHYRNPAVTGLDLVPFDELTSSRRQAVKDYCAVRHGLEDIPACYRSMPLSNEFAKL
jgi:hypothetical protein